ncbi:hypothetical protein HPB50_004196 [Hyalomma asiaticum]|uniref:Uncharacterized protein n=1 Tax=Hyalomma asiaticum TaxID=266040 RepID=A0ACB7ST95_HYAAI|nr:hypothetical protein HPB50_004196 [Hyalomma asiaticum]
MESSPLARNTGPDLACLGRSWLRVRVYTTVDIRGGKLPEVAVACRRRYDLGDKERGLDGGCGSNLPTLNVYTSAELMRKRAERRRAQTRGSVAARKEHQEDREERMRVLPCTSPRRRMGRGNYTRRDLRRRDNTAGRRRRRRIPLPDNPYKRGKLLLAFLHDPSGTPTASAHTRRFHKKPQLDCSKPSKKKKSKER